MVMEKKTCLLYKKKRGRSQTDADLEQEVQTNQNKSGVSVVAEAQLSLKPDPRSLFVKAALGIRTCPTESLWNNLLCSPWIFFKKMNTF